MDGEREGRDGMEDGSGSVCAVGLRLFEHKGRVGGRVFFRGTFVGVLLTGWFFFGATVDGWNGRTYSKLCLWRRWPSRPGPSTPPG